MNHGQQVWNLLYFINNTYFRVRMSINKRAQSLRVRRIGPKDIRLQQIDPYRVLVRVLRPKRFPGTTGPQEQEACFRGPE